jgi:acyl carrier protein
LAEVDKPADALEATLVRIWCAILKLETIGVHDSFFELGGDSLSVLTMALDVEKELGKTMPTVFFQRPTIRSLAEGLAHEGLAPSGPAFRPGRRRRGLRRHLISMRFRLKSYANAYEDVFAFQWLLGLALRGRTLDEAAASIRRLAGRRLLHNTVYAAQRLFRRFVQSAGEPLSRRAVRRQPRRQLDVSRRGPSTVRRQPSSGWLGAGSRCWPART